MQTAKLANQFAIRNTLHFEDAPGGLARAVISTPAAQAELYLQGAHLTQWTPRGQKPVLFTSPRSLFVPGKAIRGGVPIIFPWFGDRTDGKPGPAHGFARTTEWTIAGAEALSDERVEITLVLGPDDNTRALGWPDFHLRFRVTIGTGLVMELEAQNNSAQAVVFEEALHTYLAVSDVRRASITGLEGTVYIDKTDGFKRKTLGGEALRIAKETDQVHVNTRAACVVDDPLWQRRIVVEKDGSLSTVIWNPWVDKTKSMSDMGPDSWESMLCVEAANAADDAVHLAAGAVHRMTVKIRVS